MVNGIRLLCVMVMFCLPQGVWAAATSTLDRSITAFGESVLLDIHVDGSADEDPDLTVLAQDFEILSKNQSSSYNFINGSLSRSASWSIALLPKREGILLIPAISLGNMQTQPLRLQVLPQGAQANARNQDIFMEVSVSAEEIYVQAQLVYTVKLYRAVNLIQAQLTEPDMPQAIVKKLGDDKNYETVVNQRRFVVTERKYAIFPQQSGTLHLPKLQFDGQIANERSMFSQGRTMRVTSHAIDVVVLPQPQDWPQDMPWLPAEHMSIREILADGQVATYKVGEPFTRTVEISAQGLTAEQLPPLFGVATQGFKQYPDQPALSTSVGAQGVTGTRVEKLALIPVQAGELEMPGMKVFWWDIKTKTKRSVMIPPRTITVAAADPSQFASNTPPEVVTNDLPAATAVSQPEKVIAKDSSSLWQWLTLMFALSWFLTVLLWWLKSSKQIKGDDQAQENTEHHLSLKEVKNKLEKACLDGDAKAAATLLAEWGRNFYQDKTIQHMSFLKGKSDALAKEISALEQYLYSQHGAGLHWSGEGLWAIVQAAVPEQQAKEKSTELKGLYD